MKSKAIQILAAVLTVLFAQVSKAEMKKSKTHIDLREAFQESSANIGDTEKEVKSTIDRAPSSFGEPVVYQHTKKTKFEDIIPSMEEFNLMQEQMDKSTGVAAQ